MMIRGFQQLYPQVNMNLKFELEINCNEFKRLENGSKTFIRVDDSDMNIQLGDELLIHEFDDTPLNPPSNKPKGRTNNTLSFKAGVIDGKIISLLKANSSRKTKSK